MIWTPLKLTPLSPAIHSRLGLPPLFILYKIIKNVKRATDDIDDMFKAKQFVLSAFCLKCEGCCRFSQRNTIWSPHLLKEEKEKLDRKISLLPNPQARNFICTSFDIQNNKCKIYTLRPFECRLYPFLINRKDHKVFLAVDLKCPYVEKKLKSKEFKEYIYYLTNLFHRRGIIKILKNNPGVIQIYPDVLNITELKI